MEMQVSPGQVNRVLTPKAIAVVEAMVRENPSGYSHGSAHHIVPDNLQLIKVSERRMQMTA